MVRPCLGDDWAVATCSDCGEHLAEFPRDKCGGDHAPVAPGSLWYGKLGSANQAQRCLAILVARAGAQAPYRYTFAVPVAAGGDDAGTFSCAARQGAAQLTCRLVTSTGMGGLRRVQAAGTVFRRWAPPGTDLEDAAHLPHAPSLLREHVRRNSLPAPPARARSRSPRQNGDAADAALEHPAAAAPALAPLSALEWWDGIGYDELHELRAALRSLSRPAAWSHVRGRRCAGRGQCGPAGADRGGRAMGDRASPVQERPWPVRQPLRALGDPHVQLEGAGGSGGRPDAARAR